SSSSTLSYGIGNIVGSSFRLSRGAALSLCEFKLRLFSLNHNNETDPAPTVKTKLHASAGPDQVGVKCSAVFINKADPLAKHVGHRLGVGRGLHNNRRGRLNGSQVGIERGYRPNLNCAGGDLRRRSQRLTRVLNNRSVCYRLCERQRRNHHTNKENNDSSRKFLSFNRLSVVVSRGALPSDASDNPPAQTRSIHRSPADEKLTAFVELESAIRTGST